MPLHVNTEVYTSHSPQRISHMVSNHLLCLDCMLPWTGSKLTPGRGHRRMWALNLQTWSCIWFLNSLQSAACFVSLGVEGKSSVCFWLINSSSFTNRFAPEARPAIISQTHSRLCATPDRSNKQMFSQTQTCESRCKKTHCTSFVCLPEYFWIIMFVGYIKTSLPKSLTVTDLLLLLLTLLLADKIKQDYT